MSDRLQAWIRIRELPRAYVEELQQSFDEVDFWYQSDDEIENDRASNIEVVFTSAELPDSLFHKLPRLKWVQFTRGSVFELLRPALRDSAIPVSVIRGIDGTQFSEFVMGCILLWAKKFPRFFRSQQKSTWEREMPLEICGMTLGILGLGTIGTETARKAKAFGMRVLAIKRQLIPKPDFVDELWPPDRLHDLLSQSDFFVVCLPSSPETHGLLGLDQLRLLKPTAYLINVTADRVVEEVHLVKILQEGWIAGAALDALPRQPLPPDSLLWGLERAIITPRIGGFTPNRWKRLIPVFATNLKHFLAGAPLDTIDKQLGY